MPWAADDFALAGIAIFAGLARRHEAGEHALRQRPALVRAAVRHGEEFAREIEDDDLAAPDCDELAPAGRNLMSRRDDVFRHRDYFSP